MTFPATDGSSCPRCGLALGAAGAVCTVCAFDLALEPPPEVPEPLACAQGVPSVAQNFAAYRLESMIARGGMGLVYRATHRETRRTVALKMIPPQVMGDAGMRARFEAEIVAASALDHPHIVPIYEVGQCDGLPFFSMRLAEGGTLTDAIGRFRGQARAIAELTAKIARALHHAHERGVLHRDVKPGNILLDGAGEPLLADFGLAKVVTANLDLTRSLAVLGTPAYLAPEQVMGGSGALTVAADVYGLGAVLYELLAGCAPFRAESTLDLLQKVQHQLAPSPSIAGGWGVPRDLEIICLKCLAKEPAARYASAAALADDLECWLAGRPILARPATSLERSWRWMRRNPALAALSGAVFLLTFGVAVISTFDAIRFREISRRALEAERAAVAAQNEATENLRDSYRAQARASRLTGRSGQRFDALEALAKAARIKPSLELRNEAAAALSLTDLRVEQQWNARASANAPVAFDADLAHYAVETDPGVIAVREAISQRELSRLPAPENAPRANFLTPFTEDGRFLAVRHAGGLLRVWDVPGRRVVLDLPGHPTGGISVLFAFDCAFRPDARAVAIGEPGGGVTIYALPEGREMHRLPTATPAACLAFSPDGARLAVILKSSNEVLIYDLPGGEPVRRLSHPGTVNHCAWSPDASALAVGAVDSNIYLWALTAATAPQVLRGHRAAVNQLTFNHSGSLLASTARDRTIRLWSPRTGAAEVVLPGLGAEAGLRFSRDDRRLSLLTFETSIGRLEIAESRTWRSFTPPPAGESAGLHAALDFSPDGRVAVTASRQAVRLWDTVRGAELAQIAHDPGDEKAALFLGGDTLLISGRKSGLTRRALRRENADSILVGPPEAIDARAGFLLNALRADGRVLALSSRQSGETLLLGGDGFRNIATIGGVPEVWSSSLSPNGAWLATGSSGYSESMQEDGRVHEIATGQVVQALRVGGAGAASFSDDGQWLAASGTARFRLVRAGTWQEEHPVTEELGVDGSYPVFAPGSRLLAVGTTTARIHLVDPATARTLAVLDPPVLLSSMRLRFLPGGSALAAMGTNGVVHVWDLHELRAQLAPLGLDWEAPPLPPSPPLPQERFRIRIEGDPR